MAPRRSWVFAIAMLALGCQSPEGGPVTLLHLPDRHEADATLTAHLDFPSPRYQTQYIRQLEWERATLSLSHVDPNYTNTTKSQNATVGNDNGRTASVSISPVKPASGYTLTLSLLRRDRSGTEFTVASGTQSGLTLTSGANTVTVTLSPTSQGHLLISVVQPVVSDDVPRPIGGITSTLAGDGTSGFVDGNLATAEFQSPASLAFVGTHKLYVSDIGGCHSIRLVDLSLPTTDAGYVTTIAGVNAGDVIGPRASAKFNQPSGLCELSGNRLLVADANNNKIKVVNLSLAPTDAGYVAHFAGNGGGGNVNGDATTAKFSSPRGVAYDGTRYVYVADTGSHRIRRIDTSLASTDVNFVTTLAGSNSGTADGTGTGAQFNQPYGITYGADGALYVSDSGSDRIRKVTLAGVVTTVAGSGAGSVDGDKATAKFSAPRGLVYTHQQLFVAGETNHVIRVIDLVAGEASPLYVRTLAGTAGSSGSTDGTGAAARFNHPRGLTADVQGRLYVADDGGHTIRLVE